MKRLSICRANLIIALALSYSCLIDGCGSFVIQPRSWDYNGHHVGYEEVRRLYDDEESPVPRPDDGDKNHDPILLLNGFGVGSFHQHRVMPHLLPLEDASKSRVVYGMDYLGQGRSWPVNCADGHSESEEGLIYSADTWVDQIVDFIEYVILPQHPGRKVHVVGNSVGGHLAVILAARRPDLVGSICLLNATPVWGLNLPFWSGHLPAPGIPKKIGRYLFDRIRDLQTIEKYLKNAYASPEAFDRDLIEQIRACTEGDGGHAAFASIMWSPPASFPCDKIQNFYDCLSRLDCDVLLMFGKNDPWCKPAFAKRMLDALSRRDHPHQPAHRYLELDNVGHCPNHEAPQAVGKAVRAWIAASKRHKEHLTLIKGPEEIVPEPWAEIRVREVEKHNISVSLMDRFAALIV